MEILCHSTSAERFSASDTIDEGSTAFVHFKVSKGPVGQQRQLSYSWKSPGNGNAGIEPMACTFGVNERGYISRSNLSPGQHTVTVFDGNDKKLAEETFFVKAKPQPPTQKKGFLRTLFGL